ncbi:hypothetical protein Mpet_1879 [Methanolacinia petrolearia DSM 11571]|uniref:Gingipain domain-containing protein n=1 Tax=Methanolacinia petrolearia (strain DSM 11571 / OCM 486 / SEBR 4847) TaxID=679926 RepID=E1RIN9_METP4|nr:hypothetical protein [Methanolacinia petrolearia]ADN36631.1 hypothetical protein Mpet_1879 [Methanolacinia petrolearia DSM 11571]
MKKKITLFLSVLITITIVFIIFTYIILGNNVPGDNVQSFSTSPALSNNTNARCYGGYPWVEEEVYGRDVSATTIHADRILNEIGYSSDYYLESDPDLMLTNLSNSSVIYYIGHGCPSALCFDSSSCVTQDDISEMDENELNELNMAVYISFGSASDSRFGNVAYETYRKGAKSVLGFDSVLLMENSKKWSDYYMDGLKENFTVRNSADSALWDEMLYYGGDTGNLEFVKIYGSENIRIRRVPN